MTTRLEKPVRRVVTIRGFDYIIELSPAGVMFRRRRAKHRAVAPIAAVLDLANEYAERDARRERIRAGVMRRLGQ